MTTTWPTEALHGDPPVKEFGSVVDDVLHIPDYITASKWFGEFMKKYVGFNPFTEVGKAFVGDWEKAQQAAAAIQSVAKYNRSYGDVLESEIDRLTQVKSATPLGNAAGGPAMDEAFWMGHAATAAREYFRVFSSRLDQQAEVMDKAATGILTIVERIYRIAHDIENSLQEVFDVFAEAAIAAGAALVIGPLSPVMYLIKRGIGIVKMIMKKIEAVRKLVDTAMAMLSAFLLDNGAQAFNLVELAKSSYHHPGGARRRV